MQFLGGGFQISIGRWQISENRFRHPITSNFQPITYNL
jgi:hypothetical protein